MPLCRQHWPSESSNVSAAIKTRKTKKDILASYIDWDLTGPVDVTAMEAMEASKPAKGRRPYAAGEAADFLKEILANGSMPANEVLQAI